MFKEEGYFIINNQEEADLIVNILRKEVYKISSPDYDYSIHKRFLNIHPDEKKYHFLPSIFSGIKYDIKDYIKKSVESKLREVFDNSANVIVCKTIEEKHKLLKLLDKLEYKSALNITYEENPTPFLYLDEYLRPFQGRKSKIKYLTSKDNIIYFSDLIKLIKE